MEGFYLSMGCVKRREGKGRIRVFYIVEGYRAASDALTWKAELFANTERGKDAPEQIISGKGTGDFFQGFLGGAQVFG